ncbi:MAG: BrnT family toxin [Chloroflexi bacterium]|nr:BrnT family toxin [Chloroflexota bacterium]
MELEFEWDEEKAEDNLRKHKVSFDEGKMIFNDMRPEYDFSGGVRSKHYKAYHEGHTVTVHNEDGTTLIRQFRLEDGTIVLEPDVRKYFPDSESVNDALRSLIASSP